MSAHLRRFQTTGIRKLTASREIALPRLLCALMTSLPELAPNYGVFAVDDVLEGTDSNNADIPRGLKPSNDDDFLIVMQRCRARCSLWRAECSVFRPEQVGALFPSAPSTAHLLQQCLRNKDSLLSVRTLARPWREQRWMCWCVWLPKANHVGVTGCTLTNSLTWTGRQCLISVAG